MLNLHAQYLTDKGSVYIIKDFSGFSVLLQENVAPGSYHCLIKSFIDLENAIDAYKAGIDKLNGRQSPRVCGIRPNRHMKCLAKNCPKRLGGPDYWRLFRESCMYRGI